MHYLFPIVTNMERCNTAFFWANHVAQVCFPTGTAHLQFRGWHTLLLLALCLKILRYADTSSRYILYLSYRSDTGYITSYLTNTFFPPGTRRAWCLLVTKKTSAPTDITTRSPSPALPGRCYIKCDIELVLEGNKICYL